MKTLPRKVCHLIVNHCLACAYSREHVDGSWECEHPNLTGRRQVYYCSGIPDWCPLPDAPEGDTCGSCRSYKGGQCVYAPENPEDTYSDSVACDDFEHV